MSNAINRLVFRWLVWGNWNDGSVEMLRDSIASFHAYFPSAIFTLSYTQDSVISCRSILPSYLQWHSLPNHTGIVSGDELWLKWFPQDITDASDLTIVVDADVFCVSEPKSLKKWIYQEEAKNICCMEETNPQHWCYGNYFPRLRTLPKVNAGFVALRDAATMTRQMMMKYAQYRKWASGLERKWHDEQGALAEYWLEKELVEQASSIPEAQNKLLCPSANSDVMSIAGLEVIHTPYPEHPKYYELKEQIRAAIASAEGLCAGNCRDTER